MKKIVLMALCLVLIVCLAVPAMAAGSITMTPSSATVHRDGTFTVTVSVSDWAACKQGSVTVSYGNSFDLVSGEWLWVEKPMLDYFYVGEKEGGFAFDRNIGIAGKLLKLTFKVKSGAAFAKDTISVKLTLGDSSLSKSLSVTVACAHKYNDWVDYSATSHTHKCTICGKSETADHVYDNACDTTCDTCGREREITHQFSQDWTGDETGHYHLCTVCGTKDELQSHIPGEAAGEYTDQTCTVCSYVLATALGHTHRYDDTYTHDENSHWQLCTGCQEPTEAASHIFDGDCDETCDTCGYQRQITHATEEWEKDKDSHWKTCTSCSLKLEEGTHSWDAGYVKTQPTTENEGRIVYHCTVCMSERQEALPKALPTDPAGGWAWWLWMAIGFGGGVVLTAGISLLVIVISVKGKSKGRFSG